MLGVLAAGGHDQVVGEIGPARRMLPSCASRRCDRRRTRCRPVRLPNSQSTRARTGADRSRPKPSRTRSAPRPRSARSPLTSISSFGSVEGSSRAFSITEELQRAYGTMGDRASCGEEEIGSTQAVTKSSPTYRRAGSPARATIASCAVVNSVASVEEERLAIYAGASRPWRRQSKGAQDSHLPSPTRPACRASDATTSRRPGDPMLDDARRSRRRAPRLPPR